MAVFRMAHAQQSSNVRHYYDHRGDKLIVSSMHLVHLPPFSFRFQLIGLCQIS